MAQYKIKLVKSLVGRKDDQIATAASLGLRRIGNEIGRASGRARVCMFV